MTFLDQTVEFVEPPAHAKPLDFGAEGINGSLDLNGRIIALNGYHPEQGYVSLTSADPFPEDQRHNPAAVRAYRVRLAALEGFGFVFDLPVIRRRFWLAHYILPCVRLEFGDGSHCIIATYASRQQVFQWCWFAGGAPAWGGKLGLHRCAYTQLTEGGPLPPLSPRSRFAFSGGVLAITNPALGSTVRVRGLPMGEAWGLGETRSLTLQIKGEWPSPQVAPPELASLLPDSFEASRYKALVVAYDFSLVGGSDLEQANITGSAETWAERWQKTPTDLRVRRGLSYGLSMAVPVNEGVCLLTDHMLLPLSWNRDAYYVARALLSWRQDMADVVRRHLIWLFEIAERPQGVWGRCYLANGKLKDGAFQLDQQLFPLLELAEYVLETGDRTTLARLQPHIAPLLAALMERKAPDSWLFPTDETPADDPIALPYHLSSHILFWHVLKKLDRLGLAGTWGQAVAELRAAIDGCFIAERNGRRLYAYATDGAGQHYFYHDANDLPLALAPLWGFVPADDPVWRATAAFAFSEENPGGCYQGRLGSVHTPAPWPLGDIQELIIARAIGDLASEARAQDRLDIAARWDGALPEAYDAATGQVVSRHWFAWPNAALACVELDAFKP